MRKLLPLIFSLLIVTVLSCKGDHDDPYAIKDFRNSLQPHLNKIVSRGIEMYYDSAFRYMATKMELIKLSQCEHPVLRAAAFRELMERDSLNNFEILMNHLDDTAMVNVDQGEFGISHRTISDDILQEAVWNTQEEKNKTIEKVLTKHNYLRSAYHILLQLEPQEKYYSVIKDMATRPRLLSEEGYELRFEDIEYALYGLAKFRKPNDISLIKSQLLKQVGQLSHISFRLLKEFPDTAYMDVLQTYHRRQFYKFSGNRRDGFTGQYVDRADPEDFIEALVIQQSDRSARLLDTMLRRLPLMTCMPDKKNIEEDMILQIWQKPSPAYANLREKVKMKAKEILNSQFSYTMPMESVSYEKRRLKIRWWQ